LFKITNKKRADIVDFFTNFCYNYSDMLWDYAMTSENKKSVCQFAVKETGG